MSGQISLLPDTLRLVDLSTIEASSFARCYADAVILTKDRKILLQKRPKNWESHGGYLTTFGGAVAPGETPAEALVRELKEELGADVDPADLKILGAVTESFTRHTELVHVYFWHDRNGTITGCYEGEAIFCSSVFEAVSSSHIMDHARWFLLVCQKRGFLPAQGDVS